MAEAMMKAMARAAVAAAVVAVSVGCGGDSRNEPAQREQVPVSAALATAESVDVGETVELFGTVEADRTAAVSSRVMAAVTAVRVKAGDPVTRGQVLIEIDPETARGQVAQAMGALAQAQAALALAERNHARFKALVEKGAAAELELDVATMQYEQARGAVLQAEGAVEAASSVARESQVVAPFTGRVAARLVEVGDLAAPGRPLAIIESSRGRRLNLALPESAALGVRVGAPVDVSIDALPERGTIAGTVVEMSAGADPASHSFAIKVELAGEDIPSGLAGRGRVSTGTTRRVVVVPRDAVLAHGGAQMVVVQDAAGRARSRAVTVGTPQGADRVEILSGLTGGETVLVGLRAVPSDGAAVQESAR